MTIVKAAVTAFLDVIGYDSMEAGTLGSGGRRFEFGDPPSSHGRSRGQLPRDQLRDLPRRVALHRRDLLAADPLPEPVRISGPVINFVARAARMFAEILGKLLFWCGEDKIVRQRSAGIPPAVGARSIVELLAARGSCAGYGCPQLTQQAKRKILGDNLLRLHHMDTVEAKARIGKPQGTARSA